MEFKLTNQQKIEFCQQAMKKLNTLYPQADPYWAARPFLPEMKLETMNENGDYSYVTFEGPRKALANSELATFTFMDNNLYCRCNVLGKGVYSDDIQPDYCAYMYQLFGEPFRNAVLHYWEKRSTEVYRNRQISNLSDLATYINAKNNFITYLTNLGNDKPLTDVYAHQRKLSQFNAALTKQPVASQNFSRMVDETIALCRPLNREK